MRHLKLLLDTAGKFRAERRLQSSHFEFRSKHQLIKKTGWCCLQNYDVRIGPRRVTTSLNLLLFPVIFEIKIRSLYN